MIRQNRIDQKISGVRMARHLGVSKSAYNRYETGEREWPPELYARALTYLKLEGDLPQEFWSWKKHRSYWDSYAVECDPGSTWADQCNDGYPDFFREFDPRVWPSMDFRRRVRTDSLLECCIYVSWCAAGAECAYISLIAMNFPFHPLVTETGKPMSLARRAAFVLDGWIFWPQVTLLVNGKKIRVDCLAFNGKRWIVLEFDGFLHGRNPDQKKWDEKRDLSLGIEVLRFTQAEILSGHIVDLIRQKLAVAA